METKKTYIKPELKTRKVELGVFGEYGNGTPGGNDGPHPRKITNPFDMFVE